MPRLRNPAEHQFDIGDIVETDDGRIAVIHSIGRHNQYSITPLQTRAGTWAWLEGETMRLIERGPIWKVENQKRLVYEDHRP